MSLPIIPFEAGEARLDWLGLTEALAAGHRLPKAEIADTFLYRGEDTLLNRAAWIDGLGAAVKTATVFPGQSRPGHADGQRRGLPLFRPRRHAGGADRFSPGDQVEDRRATACWRRGAWRVRTATRS